MVDKSTNTESPTVVESPPNVWCRLGPKSRQKAIDAADAKYDRWMKSRKGLIFLAWDKRVVDWANENGTNYRAAMEALNVKFG